MSEGGGVRVLGSGGWSWEGRGRGVGVVRSGGWSRGVGCGVGRVT